MLCLFNIAKGNQRQCYSVHRTPHKTKAVYMDSKI